MLSGETAVEYLYRRNALPPLNRARTSLRLAPLRSSFEQYDRAVRLLMLVSAEFDYPARCLPVNLMHMGTPIDDTAAAEWVSSAG